MIDKIGKKFDKLMFSKFIFIFLWIFISAFIWINSLMSATTSSQASNGFSGAFVNFLKFFGMNFEIDDIVFWVRKSAHFSEFTALSIIVCLTFNSFKIKICCFWQNVLFYGLLTGVVDEYIQSFVSGRSSEVRDVLIDFSGIITGLLIFILINKIIFKVKNNKKVKHK